MNKNYELFNTNKKLNKGKKQIKKTLIFSDFSLAEIVHQITVKYPNEIDNFPVIKNIIDEQFIESEKNVTKSLMETVFGMLFPVLFLIVTHDEKYHTIQIYLGALVFIVS